MADGTPIEWTDATWSPIVGCSVVSPGCTNCYAMRLAGTRMRSHPSRAGLTQDSKAGPVWTGEVRFMEQWLAQPLRWRKPRMIFVCAHADLFHESVPDAWIDRVFAVMALCPQHTFQVLTKRPERMREYLSRNDVSLLDRWSKAFGPGTFRMSSHELMARLSPFTTPEHRALYHAAYPVFPLPNVWLGVSVEDQRRADERIGILGSTPAALRWVSAEPLLGRIDFDIDQLQVIDWVVAGGESGPGARPANPQWFRDLRDQCAAAGVPYLHKQNGEWVSVSEVAGDGPHHRFADGRTVRRVGKKAAGRLLDGVIHDGYPEVHPHG